MQGKPTAGQVMFFHQQKGAVTVREKKREREKEREREKNREGVRKSENAMSQSGSERSKGGELVHRQSRFKLHSC